MREFSLVPTTSVPDELCIHLFYSNSSFPPLTNLMRRFHFPNCTTNQRSYKQLPHRYQRGKHTVGVFHNAKINVTNNLRLLNLGNKWQLIHIIPDTRKRASITPGRTRRSNPSNTHSYTNWFKCLTTNALCEIRMLISCHRSGMA